MKQTTSYLKMVLFLGLIVIQIPAFGMLRMGANMLRGTGPRFATPAFTPVARAIAPVSRQVIARTAHTPARENAQPGWWQCAKNWWSGLTLPKKAAVGSGVGACIGTTLATGAFTYKYFSVPEKAYQVNNQNNAQRYVVGVKEEQGRRPSMEDETDVQQRGDSQFAYFGVYDGHGGKEAATYVRAHLYRNIREKMKPGASIKQAIIDGYLATDDGYWKTNGQEGTGTCVLSALVDKGANVLYLAWAGDSRAVLSKNGKVCFASQDHKPDRWDETKRIERSGAFVSYNRRDVPRVNGYLAVSRAIGDFYLKDQQLPPESRAVTAVPEVHQIELDGTEDFLVLACDGVWDVMKNEEVITFVNTMKNIMTNGSEIVTPHQANMIANGLVNRALKKGSSDNVSVALVFLKNNKAA